MDDVKNIRPVNSASDQLPKLEPPTLLPNSPANSEKRSALKIRLIVNLPPSNPIVESLPSKGQHADSVSSPRRLDSDRSIPSNWSKEEITGWDSDLTELSDVDSMYGSTSESEVNAVSCDFLSLLGLQLLIPTVCRVHLQHLVV